MKSNAKTEMPVECLYERPGNAEGVKLKALDKEASVMLGQGSYPVML